MTKVRLFLRGMSIRHVNMTEVCLLLRGMIIHLVVVLISLVVVMILMLILSHILLLLILHHLVEGLIRIVHCACVWQLRLNNVLYDWRLRILRVTTAISMGILPKSSSLLKLWTWFTWNFCWSMPATSMWLARITTLWNPRLLIHHFWSIITSTLYEVMEIKWHTSTNSVSDLVPLERMRVSNKALVVYSRSTHCKVPCLVLMLQKVSNGTWIKAYMAQHSHLLIR